MWWKVGLCFVVILILQSITTFHQGYSYCETKYKAELQEQTVNTLELERSWVSKQTNIVSGYEARIKALKDKYDTDIQSINLSSIRDTVSVPECLHNTSTNTPKTMPKTTSNTRGVKCYTDSQLLSKIERSLAITHECDQLAIKYNTLLEVCNAQYIQPK